MFNFISRLQLLVNNEKAQDLTNLSNDEKFDIISEINDSMLDRVNNLFDEAQGLKKRNEDLVIATLNVPTQRKTRSRLSKWNDNSTESKDSEVLAQVTRKPQLDFEDKIDNFSIFEPVIKFKYNSIKPLSILKEYNEKGEAFYSNPYEVEITSYQLLDRYLKKMNPRKPAKLNETYFKYIDTNEDLKDLVEYLKSVEEFAVDLEYHSQRSFLGFTCLMQISSRDKDFIIDTIKLRSQMHILNEVFTDPKILKIFHGADLDIKWLQKDFGIYVVNIFDTGKAAKLLQFTSFSLSFLVKHYCNENLNKKYQLADWRIRPLSEGMLNYARSDTHYLLYIFDQLINDLIKKDGKELVRRSFEDSRKVSLIKFEMPTISENSHLALIMKNRLDFNNRQKQAFKNIYSWRDDLARKDDENINYILPNHMMLKIAEVLPQEQQGILACCNPIPISVKKHLTELHSIVLRARELPLNKTEENVYSLKPIVNHIIDITPNMDILDEERVDEHHFDTYDCLLDTTDSLHKIKISRSSNNDKNNVLNFFSLKATVRLRKPETLPFDTYRKLIEIKRKEEEKRKEAEKEEEKIDINQAPEKASKDITYEPVKVEETKEEKMTRKLETTAIIDLNKKLKKENEHSITKDVNSSIDNLISSAMNKKDDNESKEIEKVNENEDEDKDSDIEEIEVIDNRPNTSEDFNYNQADYSIFSQKNQQSNQYYNPSENFLKQKQVNIVIRILINC